MSMKKKTATREKRKAEKRARKAAQRALYESYRDRGANQKSKRFRKKGSGNGEKSAHVACGNLACLKCYPSINFAPFMSKKTGQPNGMPQWMYVRWVAQQKK